MNASEYFGRTAPRVDARPASAEFLNHGAAPMLSGLSLRSNFAWVLTGNVVYAACQWGMIVALAKLGSSFTVGQFSLGLAISTPVLMFSNLNLRAVQATDAKRLFPFSDYLQLRTFMTLAALAVIAAITWFGHYGRATAMVILAVALAKGIESVSDIHYGLFQLNDRLDQTGMSMMLRGVLSVVALTVGLYLTRDVFWACVGLALVWLAALLLFDVRRGRRFTSWPEKQPPPAGRVQAFRRQWNLMRLALPLGIVMSLAAVSLNMPRYFIQARLGEHQLGIFSAMAYTTVGITLLGDSLGHCAVPRMSRLYANGRIAEFRSLLFKLLAIGGVLGFAGVLIAQSAGPRLLAIVYSPEYAAYSNVFVILMFVTAIRCVASMLTAAIMSARQFGIQVPMFALVVGCGAAGCAIWVPAAGLAGGAAAMAAAAVAHVALAAAILAYLLSAPQREPGL